MDRGCSHCTPSHPILLNLGHDRNSAWPGTIKSNIILDVYIEFNSFLQDLSLQNRLYKPTLYTPSVPFLVFF